jgi:integrase
MGAAVRLKHVAENPCQVAGAGHVDEPEDRYLPDPAQLLAVERAMPDRLRLAVTLAAVVGLRSAEARALRREDVDPDAGVIKVSHSLNQVPGGVLLVAPKTKAGNRPIEIPPELAARVRAHLDAFVAKARDGWLFPGAHPTQRDGPPVHQSTFYKAWDRARRAAEIPAFRFHDLRHHAATYLQIAGMTEAETMRVLGQRSSRAHRRYLEKVRGRERAGIEAAGRMTGLLGADAASQTTTEEDSR